MLFESPLRLFVRLRARITLDLREAFISSYALRCARGTRKDLFSALFQTGAPLAQRFGTATSAAMALGRHRQDEGVS